MEPFFTRFTRTCQLTATRALPERILIWSKGTSPGTLTGHFFKESIINPIPSAPSTFLIESLATEWHRSASYSKLNAFPHCLLKCELRHFWANGPGGRGNRKKKTLLPTPHPLSASGLIPLGSLLQNRAYSGPGHNGKLAYKSATTESTGGAFFVKTPGNTHAGTKDTICTAGTKRNYVLVLHTSVPTY